MLRSKLFYTSLMANFLVLLWGGMSPVGATVIFDVDWNYHIAITQTHGNGHASFEPLISNTTPDVTFAMARGRTSSSQDLMTENFANTDLIFRIDFSVVNSPDLVAVADHLDGFLSLGDSGSAVVRTAAVIVDKGTNQIVLDLPQRMYELTTRGRRDIDEGTPFSDNVVRLDPGQYYLEGEFSSGSAYDGLGLF